MSMRCNTEVVNLTDVKQLRDECARLQTENNMLIDARIHDGREYRQMDHRLREVWGQRQELLTALKMLHDETADYIKINNLGDPHHNQSMQMARDAIAKCEP